MESHRRRRTILVGCLALALTAATPPGRAADTDRPVEATSLLGRALTRPELPSEFRERQTALLAEARERLEAAPDDLDVAIWVGRRTAYLGRYREAIDFYTRTMERHPEAAELYRHRGHRYLTVRRLDEAIGDLEHAARLVRGQPDRIEADGLPNALGIPTSTLQTNIWYHLGLARYLKGDFRGAAESYRLCLELAGNPDMRVAASYWLYLSLRRLGEEDAASRVLAPITPNLEIIENHDYFRLLRAYAEGGAALEGLVDPGQSSVESATRAYGVAAWYLLEGAGDRARSLLERIVGGDAWAAFGHLAAEAELARVDGS